MILISLLRDEMGLGKTVQTIATMALNLPNEDAKHRTTLIVVPAALLQQVSPLVSYLGVVR